jgi:very-short-patch-repair endonuclease
MKPRIELEPSLRQRPFSVREARETGLGERRLYGSDLARPFHGVRVPAHLDLDVLARCLAYAVQAPPDAYFSHLTAAELWGVPLPLGLASRRIDVSVPWPRRAPEGRAVRGHAVRFRETDIAEVGGLRVSSPARLWCELGSRLSLEDLVAAGDFIIRRANPLASTGELAAAVEDFAGQRGRRTLREALPLLHERSESPQESRIRIALIRANLPGLSINPRVRGASGRIYRADFAFLERGLVLEYQGDYHRERDQFRRDLTRTLDLQTAGLSVVLLGPDDIRSEAAFIALVRDLLDIRAESRHIDLPKLREGRIAASQRRSGAKSGATGAFARGPRR